MPDSPERNYEEWLRKAEEDEFAAKVILDGEHFPSPGCFHTQQMVEKYLKGLLVFHGKRFPKVHDLLELESMLLEVEPDIKEFEGEFDMLSSYYTETRYPGDYPEFTLEECQKAYEAALRIKEFVIGKIWNHGSAVKQT